MKKSAYVHKPRPLTPTPVSDPFKVADAIHVTKDGKVIKLGR